MLNLDPELVRRALAAQPVAGFVTITRPDGSTAVVSRTIAEWLVADEPAPSARDLDVLLDGATRVRVVSRRSIRGEPPADSTDEKVHCDVTDPAALSELRTTLRFEDTGAHMLSPADLALEVTGPEGLRASLGVLRLALLRWEQRWRTDVALLDARALGAWIAKHGSDEPLREAEASWSRERARAEADQAAAGAWEARMPASLRPVWPRVLDDEARRLCRDDVDLTPALTALRADASADATSTLQALLAWASQSRHSGTSWGADELVVMRLIRAFASDDALVSALAHDPPHDVVAGARRFLSWHRSAPRAAGESARAWRRRKAERAALAERLVAACPALR